MTLFEFLSRPNLQYLRVINNGGETVTLAWGVRLVAYEEYEVDRLTEDGRWIKRGPKHNVFGETSHFRVNAKTIQEAFQRAVEREQMDEIEFEPGKNTPHYKDLVELEDAEIGVGHGAR